MIKDEIVEVTRRVRDEFAKQFDYDLDRMYQYLVSKRKVTGQDGDLTVPDDLKKSRRRRATNVKIAA